MPTRVFSKHGICFLRHLLTSDPSDNITVHITNVLLWAKLHIITTYNLCPDNTNIRHTHDQKILPNITCPFHRQGSWELPDFWMGLPSDFLDGEKRHIRREIYKFKKKDFLELSSFSGVALFSTSQTDEVYMTSGKKFNLHFGLKIYRASHLNYQLCPQKVKT